VLHFIKLKSLPSVSVQVTIPGYPYFSEYSIDNKFY